jgi:hypothetical protein
MSYPPAPQYPYGQYQPPPAPRDNNLAAVALVLALIGWVIPLVSIAGIVVGHIAHSKAGRGEVGGIGLAKAALVISYAWVAMMVAGFVILYFWVFAQMH